MADGIRIRPVRHKVPPNAMVILRDVARPIPGYDEHGRNKYGERFADVAPRCHICGDQHRYKTYHFQLRAGTVIVSTEIWEKLQQMPDRGGFEYVNHVTEPPAQRIAPGQAPELVEKWVPPIFLGKNGHGTQ